MPQKDQTLISDSVISVGMVNGKKPNGWCLGEILALHLLLLAAQIMYTTSFVTNIQNTQLQISNKLLKKLMEDVGAKQSLRPFFGSFSEPFGSRAVAPRRRHSRPDAEGRDFSTPPHRKGM